MDRLAAALAGSLLVLSTLSLVGQVPRLLVESAGPDGIRLKATTSSNQPLTLGASFSLQSPSWYRVGSSVPSQGVASFLHAPEPRPDTLYYRARIGTDPEPARVVPELDPLHSVAGLLTYSFQGDGSGFHFLPFDGTTQSVVMAIDGFSGKGVGAYPEEPPLSPWTHRVSADGIRAAEDRAARREQRTRQDEAKGRIGLWVSAWI